jgi:hypothetical protein
VLVEAYIGATFGEEHHLTSLFRYALRVNEGGAERVVAAPIAPAAFDADVPYRLSEDVRVLPDLHDCQRVLEQITRDDGARLVDESAMGERGVYLVQVAGPGSKSYRIDEGVEAILTLFEEPRTCSDAIRTIREATGLPELDRDFFEDLVRAGILVGGDRTLDAAHA